MIKAGHTRKLTVSRISEYGLYLADEERNEVLLPNRYTSLADKVGDEKEESSSTTTPEDRLVATTETPLLRAGEAGFLRVVDKTAHGAFLDWGSTAKDLFLPNRNQQRGHLPGPELCSLPLRRQYHGALRGDLQAQELHRQKRRRDGAARQEVCRCWWPPESPDRLSGHRREPPLGHALPQSAFLPAASRSATDCRAMSPASRRTTASTCEPSAAAGLRAGQDIWPRRCCVSAPRSTVGFLPLGDDSDPAEVTRLTQMSKKVFKRARSGCCSSRAPSRRPSGA